MEVEVTESQNIGQYYLIETTRSGLNLQKNRVGKRAYHMGGYESTKGGDKKASVGKAISLAKAESLHSFHSLIPLTDVY